MNQSLVSMIVRNLMSLEILGREIRPDQTSVTYPPLDLCYSIEFHCDIPCQCITNKQWLSQIKIYLMTQTRLKGDAVI